MGTLLEIKVSTESASEFGQLVADQVTKELLHYPEKPHTFKIFILFKMCVLTVKTKLICKLSLALSRLGCRIEAAASAILYKFVYGFFKLQKVQIVLKAYKNIKLVNFSIVKQVVSIFVSNMFCQAHFGGASMKTRSFGSIYWFLSYSLEPPNRAQKRQCIYLFST